MRQLSVLFCLLLLTGCVVSSPQKAQFNAEYPNRQDIRSHTLYRFMTKPLKPGGGNTTAQTIWPRRCMSELTTRRWWSYASTIPADRCR